MILLSLEWLTLMAADLKEDRKPSENKRPALDPDSTRHRACQKNCPFVNIGVITLLGRSAVRDAASQFRSRDIISFNVILSEAHRVDFEKIRDFRFFKIRTVPLRLKASISVIRPYLLSIPFRNFIKPTGM
jgi:hypothetical protein